jgi:hypothetical protein
MCLSEFRQGLLRNGRTYVHARGTEKASKMCTAAVKLHRNPELPLKLQHVLRP